MTAVMMEPMAHETGRAEMWRAVTERDRAFDGRFVYGVRSTGIFCRPSCPSRRPAREANVVFFQSADDARLAGFRACLRCRPADASPSEDPTASGVARARAYLDAHADRSVGLAELARHAELSASHLQRAFKRIVGLSPKQYQAASRLDRFKSRLRSGDTVSRATYEAGFGSSSRVYESADDMLGMTPAEYRRGGAGVEITYAIASAPIGRVLVATTVRGVCAVELGATIAEVEAALRRDFANARLVRDDDARTAWVKPVVALIRDPGAEAKSAIPLDLKGTAFQLKVWAALQRIPAGEHRSYGELAEAIGSPKAVRAVARACATNNAAVIVPCHRVLRNDGSLAGYKWGVERKRALLDLEAGRGARRESRGGR